MYPEIKVMKSNPSLEGLSSIIPNIVYSKIAGDNVHMTVIRPWETPEKKKYPLVVFVQGSAWTFPNIWVEVPQLSRLSAEGYVVATVEHRNCHDGHPFPAFLQDVKTAIRYLRAHADEYGVDPERVGIYGTSSGGNIALLVGLTGDSEEFKTEEYSEYSDSVDYVVDCFGPANIKAMVDLSDGDFMKMWETLFEKLAVNGDIEGTMERISATSYPVSGHKYPPFLLLHGDADMLVPYEQSVEMYHKLIDCGADARMVCVSGAPHEGSFWGNEVIEEIHSFIRKHA